VTDVTNSKIQEDAVETYDFTPEEIEILMTPTPEESGVLAGPLLDRILELEAERDAFRDRALAAESALRQGSDSLARILGRDEGLPLTLHIPSVRMIVAGLQETQRERDDLRNLTESLRVCAESSTSIAERYTDKYKELHDAARAVVDEISSPFCTPLRHCSENGCRSVAMWWKHNGLCFCDEHRPFVLANITESSYAKPWRRVVKMVKT